jgi:hypothetical protein
MLKPGITERWAFRDRFRLASALARADVILLDDSFPPLNWVELHKDVRIIQLWHASGAFKTVGYSRAGKPGDLMSDIARGLGRFVACYVWRQGLREGEMGFLVSLMAGLEAVLSGMRARELMGARAQASSAPATQPAQFGFAARR